MLTWVSTILTILGIGEQALPIIESILSPLGTFIANTYASLFGSTSASKLESDFATVQQIVNTVETDLPAAIAFVNNTYSDLNALITANPWLAKLLFATSQTTTATGSTQATANKLVEAAHSALPASVAQSTAAPSA